jgi:hypothetical protein
MAHGRGDSRDGWSAGGVFTSIEVKTRTGKLRPEQEQWLKVVRAAGGIAGVARSVEDAEALVRQGSK